jgi:hypothetical protein
LAEKEFGKGTDQTALAISRAKLILANGPASDEHKQSSTEADTHNENQNTVTSHAEIPSQKGGIHGLQQDSQHAHGSCELSDKSESHSIRFAEEIDMLGSGKGHASHGGSALDGEGGAHGRESADEHDAKYHHQQQEQQQQQNHDHHLHHVSTRDSSLHIHAQSSPHEKQQLQRHLEASSPAKRPVSATVSAGNFGSPSKRDARAASPSKQLLNVATDIHIHRPSASSSLSSSVSPSKRHAHCGSTQRASRRGSPSPSRSPLKSTRLLPHRNSRSPSESLSTSMHASRRPLSAAVSPNRRTYATGYAPLRRRPLTAVDRVAEWIQTEQVRLFPLGLCA